MRTSIHALLYIASAVVLIAGSAPEPAHAQTNQPAFRPATWGMTPADVQAMESGTPLATDQPVSTRNALASLDRVDAYMDVIRGKVGKIVYGFADDRLVHVGFRFQLKARDRSFSQRIGAHLRSRYGESEDVEVSDEGRTIRLHWTTTPTMVIGQFAPTVLHVQFWDGQHWTPRAAGTLSSNRSGE